MKRILLVEDNLIAQKVVELNLESVGCRVHIVASGEAALFVLTQQSFDFILMDIGLPDMDGYSLTMRIRQTGCITPIIGLSAHADVQHQQRCCEAGMQAVYVKPLTTEVVEEILSDRIAA